MNPTHFSEADLFKMFFLQKGDKVQVEEFAKVVKEIHDTLKLEGKYRITFDC